MLKSIKILVCIPTLVFGLDVKLDVPFKAQVLPGEWNRTLNCGHTSVLMIAGFHKRFTPTIQDIKDADDFINRQFGDPIRNYNGYYTGGTRTNRLIELAKYLGLPEVTDHSGWRLDDLRHELEAGRPVIVGVWTDMAIYTGVPHWMVLTGMKDDIVYVNDPGHSGGKDNQYDISTFDAAWRDQGSVAITIAASLIPNQPPRAGFLMSAQGKNATQGQTLNLSLSQSAIQVVDFNALPPRSTDPDGDSTIASYEWRSNGTRIPNSSFTGGVMQFGFGVGTHAITLMVKDNIGATSPVAQGSIVVTANKAPTITSTPPTTSVVGQPYSYQILAQDPENGSLTYSLTTAPSGMTMSQTGLIQWQPAASQTGSNPVTVRVADPFLLFATQSFNVNVVAGSTRMKEARAEFAASSLNSGFVLVTGGGIGGGILSNTAELYNPATGTWRYTFHSMSATRSAHTSTRLSDGRVLIVGGLGSAAGSAEIFDPATETFTPTPPMNSVHIKHAAVLLSDGRVLVIGGGDVDGYTILATTEIYNPASNAWTLAAPLPVPARRHDAVLLADGTVLSAGGSGYLGECCFPNASVHRYNPANNTWRTMVPMLVPRLDHTLTLLPNGKVLIAGGTNTTATVKSTEIYDPAIAPNGQTQFGPDLISDCRGHTATRLANGDVLVAGGFSALLIQGASTFPPLAQLFRYSTNSWSSTAILPRSYHIASILSNGDVLLAGGVDANGVTNTSEIWKSGP